MPIPNDLDPDLRKLLFGDPWGGVYPPRNNPPPLEADGRTVALKILRRYLAALDFMRPGDRKPDGKRGPPVPFKLDPRNIHIGWPDYEHTLQFPAVVFLHNPGEYTWLGLNNYIQEETRDVYGKDSVVMWMSEYKENVILEIWANKRAELRALLNGIETSLSPTETMYGLRFRMPDYYDQLVCFTPGTRQEYDEEDSARNRRRARIEIEMRYTVVALVNVEPIQVTTQVNVDVDPDFNTEITTEELETEEPKHLGPCDPCQ